MKTFKEHILEKLKVSTKNTYRTPTYQEYYDLLDAYCRKNNEKFLDLNRVFDFNDDLLPRFKNNKNRRPIITLRPAYPNDPEIIIKTYDFTLDKEFYNSAKVSYTADEEVDFMEDEDIEKTVKYMKEHIK